MAPNTRRALVLFSVLVAIDLGAIALHVVHTWTPYLERRIFSIWRDAGIGEHFQYLKELLIAFVLVGLAVARSERGYAVWAGCFAWLMVDDATRIHERLGRWLGARLHYPAVAGWQPEHLGELTGAGVVGLVLLTGLAAAYVRGSPGFRRASRALLLLLAALGMCGVGVDALDTLVAGTVWGLVLGTIEDGGEMVVMSVIVAYAWWLAAPEIRIDGRPVLRGGDSLAPAGGSGRGGVVRQAAQDVEVVAAGVGEGGADRADGGR